MAFVGVAAGQGGALRAIDHLQAIFHYLGVHVFGRHVMLSRIIEAIDANVAPADPMVEELLQKLVEEFAEER